MSTFLISAVIFILFIVLISLIERRHSKVRNERMCRIVEDALPDLVEKTNAAYEKKYGSRPDELIHFPQKRIQKG